MTDFAITGKKGTGKSSLAVKIIRQALSDGKRVATNLDLRLEHLLPASSRATVLRIPDKPTLFDLESIGHGNPDSYDEDKNGVLVLDELGSWLNARSFSDKERMPVLDWLVHSRKNGWDVYYIMQNINQVDKQVREAFIEYVGRCISLKKMRIPFIGTLINLVSFGLLSGRLPPFHLCNFRLSTDPTGVVVDRELYTTKDVHKAYDTRQKFSQFYPHGLYSMLSAWHLKGRYQEERRSFLSVLKAWWAAPAARQAKLRTRRPHPRLAPLMSLSPELRWRAARDMVMRGVL